MINQNPEIILKDAFTNTFLKSEPTSSLLFWKDDVAYMTKMEDGILQTKPAKCNKDLSWEWI